MPPALQHKKTRTGCKRCKTRKVKCDEGKPKCGACSRHNVECDYPHVFEPERLQRSGPSPSRGVEIPFNHDTLELRLMHQWTAYTCTTLSTISEFWKYELPLLGMNHRHLINGMFAVSALQLSRQAAGSWPSTDMKMPPLLRSRTEWKLHPEASEVGAESPDVPKLGSLAGLAQVDVHEMLEISRQYYKKALEGNKQGIVEINEQNIRATFVCAVMISMYTLFSLSSEDDGVADENAISDGIEWVSVSRATLPLAQHWARLVGDSWAHKLGVMYGEPDLSDPDPLFRAENREHLTYLLAPVSGEQVNPTDRSAFGETVSYIGLLHKGIVEGFDAPLGTQRRLLAFPARVPGRFTELLTAREPRAVAVLVHLFAILKLAENRLPWLQGIAQRQVPKLCELLPEHWKPVVDWPLSLVN